MHGFGDHPNSWYYLCSSRQLDRGPRTESVGEQKFVGYRTSGGAAVVMDARCSHMGADLSRGCVAGDRICCPFHAWEYGPDGRCARIPATDNIPPLARQTVFPVAELGGHVVFFNQPQAIFPMPFFDGLTPADLLPARPFDLIAELPWYIVGANAFDLQHFRVTHGRTPVGEHTVESPGPFARRLTATYAVTGTAMRDRLTRRFSGPQVTMGTTVWSGSLMLVTARFRRTTSYGMVFTRPLTPRRTLLRVIIWVPRSRSALGRLVVDPLDAWVRRSFIRDFLAPDAYASAGAQYNPATLIDADRELAQYFLWLQSIPSRTPLDQDATDAGDAPAALSKEVS